MQNHIVNIIMNDKMKKAERCDRGTPENKRKIIFPILMGGDIAAEDNKLLSSKKDALLHGIGMQSVKLTVEKYKGTFEYHFTEECFTVSIALFI